MLVDYNMIIGNADLLIKQSQDTAIKQMLCELKIAAAKSEKDLVNMLLGFINGVKERLPNARIEHRTAHEWIALGFGVTDGDFVEASKKSGAQIDRWKNYFTEKLQISNSSACSLLPPKSSPITIRRK